MRQPVAVSLRKTLNAVSQLIGSNSLPVVVAQPDERHANRTASVLEWYDNSNSRNNLGKFSSIRAIHKLKKKVLPSQEQQIFFARKQRINHYTFFYMNQ